MLKEKKVLIYIEAECPLCDEAIDLLTTLQLTYNFSIEKRFITEKNEWFLNYQFKIPVIQINDKEIYGNDITYETIEKMLNKNN